MELSKWITVSCMILLSLSVCLDVANAAPISFDFSKCMNATYAQSLNRTVPLLKLQCCPVMPEKPIIDGLPPMTTKVVRVRKAAQCAGKSYAEKLARGYELMRALPADDPRSFEQQWKLHCSYCGGAFFMDHTNNTGIDVHWSWLFLPWHRLYLYFHERILQSLLDDPTFSFTYWNWDNPFAVGNGKSHHGHCLKAGHDFPAIYANPSLASYDEKRSLNAKGQGRFHYPDLTYTVGRRATAQLLYNATEEDFVASNLNVMYQTMISGGITKETFLGSPYHAGDPAGGPGPGGPGGVLEFGAHTNIHLWIGQESPNPEIDFFADMGALEYAAKDPVFFSHHSNIDRLWEVWKSLGPLLGQTREDYSDPDFLNASFLFYDENKDLRRVTIADSLDTTKLGYVYQRANDASWIHSNRTKCSNLNYTQLLTKAKSLPVPLPDVRGKYHLEANKQFTMVIDRPSNPHGEQEFLAIKGIKLNRMLYAGFDIYVNLLSLDALSMPARCAEYNGRFSNMATSFSGSKRAQHFTWREGITKTFVDIRASDYPSKVVITLMPFGHAETITFESIAIST